MLSTSVSPPSSHGVRWCACRRTARTQPGKTQCLSRAIIARRCCLLASRCVRPSCSTSPVVLWVTIAWISPVHAIRAALDAGTAPTVSIHAESAVSLDVVLLDPDPDPDPDPGSGCETGSGRVDGSSVGASLDVGALPEVSGVPAGTRTLLSPAPPFALKSASAGAGSGDGSGLRAACGRSAAST